MPTIRFVLHMNDGTIRTVYTNLEVQLLQGQYKSIKKEKMTDEGWKGVFIIPWEASL